MVSKRTLALVSFALLTAGSLNPAFARQDSAEPAQAQSPAPPSRAETIAMGYLRTLWVAQREYQKSNGRYATALSALVGKGSFTRRMAQTERGDYNVRFQSDGKEYSVALVPKEFDSEHRAFFMDQTGVIRFEPDKVATASSPEVPKNAR